MSATPTVNPSSGADRTARSPPKETSTPQSSRPALAAAAGSAVEHDRTPPRHRAGCGKCPGYAPGYLGEVAVIAQAAESGTDRRIDGPTGHGRGTKGDAEGVTQVGRDGHRHSGGATVEPADLGVGPEPAGQGLDPIELAVEDP
jgi:hypothetical protein